MFLADIESFDPDPRSSGAYTKFMCNQPACAGKLDDAGHKSLSVNMESGVWHCFRCSAHGVLEDDIFVEDTMDVARAYVNRRTRMKSKFDVQGPE